MAFQKLRALLMEIFHETVQNENELSHSSATFILACILQMYVRAPQAVQYKQRVASFGHFADDADNSDAADVANHQSRPLPSAAEFASAGFFHTGLGDETVCGVCGLGLRDWQPADQADASHARYALTSALAVAEALRGQRISTCVPCLFLEVHRLLASDLPLARKNLTSASSATTAAAAAAQEYVNNLSDRLAAAARMLVATGPPTWPVQNARRLGYSDDLILLGLWRLQSEAASTSTPISFVPRSAMSPSPQDTAILLRSILRIQESGLDDEDEEAEGDAAVVLAASSPAEEADGSPGSASEDAELAALPRRWRWQRPSAAAAPRSKLPGLASILTWWTEKWPQQTQQPEEEEEEPLPADSTLRPPASAVGRKKAKSTSM